MIVVFFVGDDDEMFFYLCLIFLNRLFNYDFIID